MLQSIDTLIAFVVIMTVASLFVTIAVQICSAGLSLRGKNLANALALTFQSIEPDLGPKAHQLAARILSDPLLSDSTRTQKSKNRNSAVAFPNKKTPWHFTDVFGAARLASAIRPEEVYGTLKKLALLAGNEEGAATRREPLAETAEKVLSALELRAEGARVSAKAEAGRLKFDAWFGSAQDRAQQWFQLHTRGLTIAASALVALFLQLDAVEIFHFVSTNAASRSALLGSAGKLLENSDGAWDEQGGLIRRLAEAWRSHDPGAAPDLSQIRHTAQLREELAKRPAFKAEEYDSLARSVKKAYFDDQQNKLADLTSGVSATGFEFIPVKYWRWPSSRGAKASLGNVGPHLPGIALCAALLTLGAPYWYNLLKNLTSLRPALAQRISQEEAQTPGQR